MSYNIIEKIYIWIHKNDVINNKITDYTYTRPYHDRNDEWVQVSISQDYLSLKRNEEVN